MSKYFDELTQIMARLHGPDGCPWDRAQDHRSLRHHTIEEAYELSEAIDAQDPEAIAGELGDLLFHIVFHAQLGHTSGTFDIDDVIRGICNKLERRHPHVFGDAVALDPETVERNWEAIKAKERKGQGRGDTSVLDAIGPGLPALVRARKLSERATKIGFDWPDVDGAISKVREELQELEDEISDPNAGATRQEEEIGDLLFAVVNVARKLGLDPETALAGSNRRFDRRFRTVEAGIQERGSSVPDATLAEMEELWQKAKTWESDGENKDRLRTRSRPPKPEIER